MALTLLILKSIYRNTESDSVVPPNSDSETPYFDNFDSLPGALSPSSRQRNNDDPSSIYRLSNTILTGDSKTDWFGDETAVFGETSTNTNSRNSNFIGSPSSSGVGAGSSSNTFRILSAAAAAANRFAQF